MMSYDCPHPVSRTYQYKKITKPLLERKRRARINRCLDELKDLMVDAFETEGENISKLEKADILELTVRHLQRLQASRSAGLSGFSTTTISTIPIPPTAATSTTIKMTTMVNDEAAAESRWQSGFGHCATEACRFLATLPGKAAENLARHLAVGLQNNSKINSLNINPNTSTTLIDLDPGTLIDPCLINSIPSTDTNNIIVPNIAISSNKTSPRVDVKKGTFENTSTVIETMTGSSENNVRFNDDDRTKLTFDIKEIRRNSMAKHKITNHQRINTEDDEVIDVERVDDGDPMWRPW
ncbi:transcription factor HES-4-B-like [Vespa mandarinia]|uniref:transcription factor HES-4-B-like n=1 Tax=Vespa mandarinia TaxID=7446 RepID=UPI001608EDFC|nr:transcription factor HES-4-B-like [Vespa mandarinia]XP_035738139.1 transcription factor HES-4-B-like [Vespa mandarinia]XP_035738146.1 transcription factor HES-4-B-like [Vespa mandarinia]XP_035738153.1 transcription factor HES-4-B-like [Vespa mandarinia]XP_035738165.1 transcription factor HES-4-B-like [Vespa mandarinia]XP_035738175.1 transcription factor HES-4-B-like [Vespa mandarinia]XP_035738184.1 transcription factor HES-4-B-like [Vespa mandarinia]XP_035738190.1 transcription factor HES